MKDSQKILFPIIVIFALFFSACTSDCSVTKNGGEEYGTELALNETYDKVRNGARLVLSYDSQNNLFKGFVENITNKTLKQVWVEVHLSNDVELGPTTPTDLNPGESIDVTLEAKGETFDGWTAYPEVGESGGSEHGHGGKDNQRGEKGEGGHNEGGSD